MGGGLFGYTLAGGSFISIGALETLLSTTTTTAQPSPSTTSKTTTNSSLPTFIATAILSLLFILNSTISLVSALNSKDQIGTVIQYQIISISAVFLLYSAIGILTHANFSVHFPSQIFNLISLFGFLEEFFLFYLQRKDTSGVENRYYDLLLVPIGVCVFTTLMELKNPNLRYPRMARGVGLISQGMWFVQMGFSFFSNAVAHGCHLVEKSGGNFTIMCKGHMEYHRGRAIAVLQFNCHLALLVTLMAGFYSLVAKNNGGSMDVRYRPLGAEMQELDNQARFTLESDDDEPSEVKEDGNFAMEKVLPVVMSDVVINGHGSHH